MGGLAFDTAKGRVRCLSI